MSLSKTKPPRTHPYIATITIDPVSFQSIQREIEYSPELYYLDCDASEPDLWKIRIGCASSAVASGVEENWD